MSYSRWMGSDWYIFWTSGEEAKYGNEPVLAIWCNQEKEYSNSSYYELKEAKGDYSYISGYNDTDEKEHVNDCIKEFIWDVENELMHFKLNEKPMLNVTKEWRPTWFETDFISNLEPEFWKLCVEGDFYDTEELEKDKS